MQLKGTVTQMLPTASGMGAKGEWHRGGFVIETEGQYPKTVAITCWGLSMLNEVQVGRVVLVDFSVESREYNGKFYTDVRALKVEAVGQVNQSKFTPKVVNEIAWPEQSPGEMLNSIPKTQEPEKNILDEDMGLPF